MQPQTQMKKSHPYALLLALILISSCKKNPVEQAIIDYKQTIGTTKLDLKMKILSLENVGSVTSNDSAKILEQALYSGIKNDSEIKNLTIDSISTGIKENIIWLDDYIAELDSNIKALEANGKTQTTDYFFYKRKLKENIEDADKTKATYATLDSLNTIIKKYQAEPDKVIATKWKCKYSFINPLLNNTLVETVTTFVVTPDYKVSVQNNQ